MFQTRPQIADEPENAPKAGGPGRGKNYPPRALASRASARKTAETTDLHVRALIEGARSTYPPADFCRGCRLSDQGRFHGVSGWSRHRGAKGGASYALSPRRLSAVCLLDRVGNRNGDRDCEPARVGDIGRESPAYRARKF